MYGGEILHVDVMG